MRINLEKLEKSYIRVHYIDRKLEVSIVHKLIALKLRVLIDHNCLLS